MSDSPASTSSASTPPRPAPRPVLPLPLGYRPPQDDLPPPSKPFNGVLAQRFYDLCWIAGYLLHAAATGRPRPRRRTLQPPQDRVREKPPAE